MEHEVSQGLFLRHNGTPSNEPSRGSIDVADWPKTVDEGLRPIGESV
jgi:hypothetical protein